ncbi:nitronate monooxygenase [Desulfohalobiaceae bacterium Ax17]|jgi:nitronate monooxygenase|uniref:NAD(P)H-dependent flavin oxidoreductase n=1 Tax=Desulfovulcanus ferrireducens TaxID=2831190 RepID=UPI00207BB2F9|nr:nitronate monooxygenase family protein [Desulfovulcanus ferrireducens]MBT8763810.1 nitronate monooxygenase [Desulfovulcanus ferrireducens]
MLIPKLKIGVHEAEVPIIQGGMGVGVSLHSLASAVAKMGGIGVIAAAAVGFLAPDFDKHPQLANIRTLKEEITLARNLAPGGIIGVNIMVALSDYEDLVTASFEAGADIIFSGAGLPLNLPKLKEKYPGNKTALVPIISSARAADILCKKWLRSYNYLPDAFVLEGPKAGGHLGFSLEELTNKKYRLEQLVLETLQAITPYAQKAGKPIPLIVAGGVYSGEDIARFLNLGASGVQMATRFVVTEECDASEGFKKEHLRAKKEDIVFIKSPVGLPGRAVKNKFLEAVERGEKVPFKCPHHCIKTCKPKKSPYCISLALINAQQGKLDEGFAFAGSNTYRSEKIVKVKDLIEELLEGIKKA